MRRLVLPALVAVLATLALLSTTYAQTPDGGPADLPLREPADSMGRSFEPSNPYCYQPDPAQDACYINFRQLNATGSRPMVTMTLAQYGPIAGDTYAIARYDSFGEGSLVVTHDMNGMGFRVPCGAANPPGGDWGNAYTLTLRGQDDQDLLGFYSINLTCPAYDPGVPTAIGANSFTATLERLAPYQGFVVALIVGIGLLANVLLPRRLRGWRTARGEER